MTMVLDLIESGASAVETTAAIGASHKSKIIFVWLKASEDAGEFGARPDAASPWCIVWGERPLEFFHVLYKQAQATGRANRAARNPLRGDLEQRLFDREAARPAAPQQPPPRLIVEHFTSAPVIEPPDVPQSVEARPPLVSQSVERHARQSKPLDAANVEPPSEGRFSMTADKPKSFAQRRAGTVELVDGGIKQW